MKMSTYSLDLNQEPNQNPNQEPNQEPNQQLNQNSNQEPPANPNHFENPFDEDSNYRYQDNCLTMNDGKGSFSFLANYIIVPEHETIRDNGIEEDREFCLRAICNGRELQSISLPAKAFTSTNFIIETWGLALRQLVKMNTISFIKDSISEQAANIHRRFIYTHTGWRKIMGEWVFLHAGGMIAAPSSTGKKDSGKSSIRVELDGRLSRYNLPEVNRTKDNLPNFNTAMQLFKVAPSEVMLPLVSIAFLSPLNEFMRQAGVEPSFLVYLLGQTGSMKSTLAALVLCLFGRFDNKSLPESFKDTTNSLEKQGFLLKDVLTVIDDYHPTGSRQEAQKMQATAQAVSRMYGDRTGRGRMNADTNLRMSYIPRGNAVITGEDLPEIGESGIARNIVVGVEKTSINKRVLTQLQEKSDDLGVCMSMYISWLCSRAQLLPQKLKEQFNTLRQKVLQEGGSGHGRTAEAIAHLQIGILYFSRFMLESGAITAVEASKMTENSWGIFLEIATKQNLQLQNKKPALLFMEAIKELLATGEIYVIDTKTKTVDNLAHSPGFVGYEDDSFYYLYADTAFKNVVQFYSCQGVKFPVGKEALLKSLVNEFFSVPYKGRTTSPRKVKGKSTYFLTLHKEEEEEDAPPPAGAPQEGVWGRGAPLLL